MVYMVIERINMNDVLLKKMQVVQKSEITEYWFYYYIAKREKNIHNKEVLNHIADVELSHYHFWRAFTKKDCTPNYLRVFWYYIIVIFLGLTFGIRLMEKKRKRIKKLYSELSEAIDGINDIIRDENDHEKMHIDELDEERLKYMGSIVLGLNDALVEFTGAIAGFTFALGNSHLIALAGLISGISASLSMASSEYLATKQNYSVKYALRSAISTGLAYFVTVIFMILPYFLISNVFICLGLMISIVIIIIFIFNYYVSIAKELKFTKRFIEMTLVSMGIASLSFIIGILIRNVLGINV